MSNRQLTPKELRDLVIPLLMELRERLVAVTKGDKELLWALRRKIFKELMYDERGKPMYRVALKKKKKAEQNNRCAHCNKRLPAKGSVLDRLKAMAGYTVENTRLLCPKCDTKIQVKRGYR